MVINNKIIPFGKFKAINLCGIIFTKMTLSSIELRHEKIHSKQAIELLVVGFYLWYMIEWGIRLLKYRNSRVAYFNICFEREAYVNQKKKDYETTRKHFSFLKYMTGPELNLW
ncbi:MAG: hypothetical protein MJY95_05730 [Bacteroidaceae bacterium]|nr:hypothetical protein [Bacteroidaceae bacterium]